MSYLWREYENTPRALAFRAQTHEEWCASLANANSCN
jgi:hypothetical protein